MSLPGPDRSVQRQVQQHQAPATTTVRRQALLGIGTARPRGKHCRTEKRKVGGSRPPLTTQQPSPASGEGSSFQRVLRSRPSSLTPAPPAPATADPLACSAGLSGYRRSLHAAPAPCALSRVDHQRRPLRPPIGTGTVEPSTADMHRDRRFAARPPAPLKPRSRAGPDPAGSGRNCTLDREGPHSPQR